MYCIDTRALVFMLMEAAITAELLRVPEGVQHVVLTRLRSFFIIRESIDMGVNMKCENWHSDPLGGLKVEHLIVI